MNSNRSLLLRWMLIGLCCIAAFSPLLVQERSPTRVPSSFDWPPWPTEIDGKALRPLPLNPRDAKFAIGFPGQIQEFTDGQRDYIMRHICAPTRMLHSSADCLRGSGFSIVPQPVWREASGVRWSCFTAARRTKRLRVLERISDIAGNEWTDVSAWYWSALLKKTSPPWLAVTIVETE